MTAYELWTRARSPLGFSDWVETPEGRAAIAARSEGQASLAPSPAWSNEPPLPRDDETPPPARLPGRASRQRAR